MFSILCLNLRFNYFEFICKVVEYIWFIAFSIISLEIIKITRWAIAQSRDGESCHESNKASSTFGGGFNF